MKRRRDILSRALKTLTVVMFFSAFIGAFFVLFTPHATPSVLPLVDGQVDAQCVGWPTPHVEIQWSAHQPPGALPPNINAILRWTDGASGSWFFGGGYPGVNGKRIDGSFASAWGPGGYPIPNFAVYDLRDTDVLIGHTYAYTAKYRPETSSVNTATVTISAADCGAVAAGPGVSLVANPTAVSSSGWTTLTWSSNNATSCVATGAWAGSKPLSGSQIVTGVMAPTTFGLTCTSGAQSASAVADVVIASPVPPPIPAPGSIVGVCLWNNGKPQVVVTWSRYPPPGQGSANSNGLQKGDSYPDDPQRYWEFLSIGPQQYTYTDSAVQMGTPYQYRAKYRPNLPSSNTYTISVSAANCGGPVVSFGILSVAPTFQNTFPNVTAILNATGGDGTYRWEAPGGTLTGSGPQVGVTYTNGTLSPILADVSVYSGGQKATATVRVDGVQTFEDSIDILGGSTRYVLINGGDVTTNDPNVILTLAHGFSTAAASVTMGLSNTPPSISGAFLQPFQKSVPWNLCNGLSTCPGGLYQVYATFAGAAGTRTTAVFGSITYLADGPGQSSILINSDAPVTTDRQVSLTLQHGFVGIPDDEISLQIGNTPQLLDAAVPVLYSPWIAGWDLCDGKGSLCANGPQTVYAKFCARGNCAPVVQDSIDLQSPWPDWGVRINEDAAHTNTTSVQLRLNPWFDRPGTTVLVGNLPDFSDGTVASFSPLLPWVLCDSQTCLSGTQKVFVRYQNTRATTDPAAWPAVDSPRYQDDIVYDGAMPSPFPAGVLINDGAVVTTSRFVRLTFTSPFPAGSDVTMRPVNEGGLFSRDLDIIRNLEGGIPSQPAVRGGSFSVNPRTTPELESGSVRPFQNALNNWDLCAGRTTCPPGTYKVYGQFYRTPKIAKVSGVWGIVGDEVSPVYYDTIVYTVTTPTPAPSASAAPSPTTSVLPSTAPSPSGSPGPSVGAGLLPPWVLSVVQPLVRTVSGLLAQTGASGVVVPVAIASAAVAVASAVAAVAPLVGPGLAAFTGQWFMGAFGLLPKRKKVWGTIYDANTKRPIPFAKVQLLDRNRRVLETRIADTDGRYGFLTTPESLTAKHVQISILPSRTGYLFPSRTPVSVDTFIYNNLYYGDLVEVNEKTLINFDVPMDPIAPSRVPLILKSPSIALGASAAAIADAGFWVGLIMVPLNFLLVPNPFTFGVLCLFLGTASLRLFGIAEHAFGTVTNAQTGRPMPFALITLNDTGGKRVGFTVSDEQGRYFLVAEKGTYEITVFTPASVVPSRQAIMTVRAKKGWITRALNV